MTDICDMCNGTGRLLNYEKMEYMICPNCYEFPLEAWADGTVDELMELARSNAMSANDWIDSFYRLGQAETALRLIIKLCDNLEPHAWEETIREIRWAAEHGLKKDPT